MKPRIVISFVFPENTGENDLARFINNAMNAGKYAENPVLKPTTMPRYVYGLRGISELFGVSKATAQKYKDGIIKEAVYQCGRKIVVDVEKAIELFSKSKGASL